MKSERIVVACALVAAGVVAVVGEGQRQAGQFDGVELSIEPVAGQVHMIQRPDGIANIGVLAGSEGVLLVDSLFAPLSDKVVAAVREVTDSDIRFLINTHIHVDHVGGNENLGGARRSDLRARQHASPFSGRPDAISETRRNFSSTTSGRRPTGRHL